MAKKLEELKLHSEQVLAKQMQVKELSSTIN
jgi:hypothetical protein